MALPALVSIDGKEYPLSGSFDCLTRPSDYPTKAPKFNVGDYVYSWFHGANVPVVGVTWRTSAGFGFSGWRVSTWGYTADESQFFTPSKSKRTHVYTQVGPHTGQLTYVRFEEVSR